MDMLIEYDELITISMMQEQPILVVEGIDDIPVYEKIVNKIAKQVEIYSPEYFVDVESGCRGVTKIISLLNDNFTEELSSKYVLGLVDKDVRDFRNELIVFENLLNTIYYSMESHLVSDAILKKIFSTYFYILEKDVTSSHVNDFWDYFYLECEYLYLASIDALRSACIEKSQTIFTYKSDYNLVKNPKVQKTLKENKIENLIFSKIFNLEYDLDNIKRVCKGKWFLGFLCEKITYYILNEIKFCNELNTQCSMCKLGRSSSCFFNIRIRPNKDSVEAIIISNVEHGDFDFLFHKLNKNFGI